MKRHLRNLIVTTPLAFAFSIAFGLLLIVASPNITIDGLTLIKGMLWALMFVAAGALLNVWLPAALPAPKPTETPTRRARPPVSLHNFYRGVCTTCPPDGGHNAERV